MDFKEFLSNFEFLSENDQKTQNLAIQSICTTVKTQLTKKNGAGAENGEIPACLKRTFKFQFLTKSDSLIAQYAIDRLIKGLISNRNDSRNGFSRALALVLHATAPHIDLVQVRAAVDYVTNAAKCTKNEIKDVLCGRLHGYFILERLGFFAHATVLGNIGDCFKLIWEVYDSKVYFQDAACWLIYSLTKHYIEHSYDPRSVLSLLKGRLEKLFDPGFVEAAVSVDGGLVGDVGNDFDTFGKCFSGILPCPLFGLYVKVNQLFMSLKDYSIKNDPGLQWLNKRLLVDPTLVSMCLRYVASCPKYYPFIGWFLEAFVDLILEQTHPEPIASQLWQCILLNLLSPNSTSTRQIVGLDLCARILQRTKRNIKVTIALLQQSGPFLKLLQSHLSARGNKRATFTSVTSSSQGREWFSGFLRSLIQSQTFASGEADFDILKDSVASYGAASIDNYRLFKELSQQCAVLSGGVLNVFGGAPNAPSVFGSATISSTSQGNVGVAFQGSAQGNVGAASNQVANATATTAAADAIHAIFKALSYSNDPYTNQFTRDFIVATDQLAFFKALESKMNNLELCRSFSQLKWIFSMLQACLDNCHRRDLLHMFERFATLSTCWIPFDNGTFENRLYLTVAMVESTGLGPFIIASPSPIFGDATADPAESSVDAAEFITKCIQLNSYLSMAIASGFVKLQHFNTLKTSQYADEFITCDDLIILCERLYWRLSRHGFNGRYKARPSDDGTHLLLSDAVGTFGIKLHAKDASMASRELFKVCKRARLRLENGQDGPLLCCGYIMAVASLLIERQLPHYKAVSHGLIRSKKGLEPLVPLGVAQFFNSFTQTLVDGFTEATDFARVRQRLACAEILDAIFLEDETPLSALLHSVAKRLWSLLSGDLPPDVIRSVLKESLLHCQLPRLDSNGEENDDESEEESDVSFGSTPVAEDVKATPEIGDDEEAGGAKNINKSKGEIGTFSTGNITNGLESPVAAALEDAADASDHELESLPSREPIDRDTGIGKSVSSGIKRKRVRSSDDRGDDDEEEDIVLSPEMALKHLGQEGDDDDDQENAARHRNMLSKLRRINRGLGDLDPETLNHKIRCGELVSVYLLSCKTFGAIHLQAANVLYRSLIRATMIMQRPKLEPRILNCMHVYSAKLMKMILVLSKSIKKATSVEIDSRDGHVLILNDTCNQIINAQCSKLTNTPRLQHISSVLVSLCHAIESQWPEASLFNSRVVAHLKVGFVAMALGRVCEFKVDFIRHLCNLCPQVLSCIDYVKLALGTSVQFKQSLLLDICTLVLKNCPKTLLNDAGGARKQGRFVAKIDLELGGVCKGVDALELGSDDYYTYNLLESSGNQLLVLLDRLHGSLGVKGRKENGVAVKGGKCGISSQLLKSVAGLWLLVLGTLKSSTAGTLYERLGLLASSLKKFESSAKQHNILQVALARAKPPTCQSLDKLCA